GDAGSATTFGCSSVATTFFVVGTDGPVVVTTGGCGVVIRTIVGPVDGGGFVSAVVGFVPTFSGLTMLTTSRVVALLSVVDSRVSGSLTMTFFLMVFVPSLGLISHTNGPIGLSAS